MRRAFVLNISRNLARGFACATLLGMAALPGLGSLIAFGAAPVAHAAEGDFPAKPIRLVVPFGAGGYGDTVARLLGKALSDELKVPIVVDVKAGGSTIIGTEIVARAAPDGYTLLMISTTHAVNPSLFRKLPYDPVADFAPVTLIDSTPYVLVANPAVPAKNLAELVAYAKANPGKLSYGSSGPGSAINLTGELFKMATGTDILHVPYKGSGPALTDLIAGHIQLTFTSTITALPYMKDGRLRGIAVTSAGRNSAAPDLPSVAESGHPAFEASSWLGILAPAKTPAAIVSVLQRAIARALQSPVVAAAMKADGAEIGGGTPEAFAQFYAGEIRKWGMVIEKSGIKAE